MASFRVSSDSAAALSTPARAVEADGDTLRDLVNIVRRAFPGYELVDLREVFPPGWGGKDAGDVRGPRGQRVAYVAPRVRRDIASFYRQADDDTYVVWIKPAGTEQAQPPGPKSVTLSRRLKRVISMEG